MPRIILLNGPARSGKDSLANAFVRHAHDQGLKAEVTKFALPLKEKAHALFGFAGKPHDFFENEKDVPQAYLYGKTWRQVYIAVSELLFKPMFGKDIFGRLLVDEIEIIRKIAEVDGETDPDYFLVSDSGFLDEASVVVSRYGAENIILVHLERDGYDFTGDSRGYINLPEVRTLKFNLGEKLSLLHDCTERLFMAAQRSAGVEL